MSNEIERNVAPHPWDDSRVTTSNAGRAQADKHLIGRDARTVVRTCTNCGGAFQPSSRHLRCPSCRRQASHELCECGSSKQRESLTCRGCQATSGALNGNWRGGRTTHKAGYVMRRVPLHPRASARHPYVFEHILVMEELLGRYLRVGETVHHINGVKDDNAPENLELWIKPQPSGIRARDAVAWAHEILNRYDRLQTAPTTLTLSTERSWSWGESNPRPSGIERT